MTDTAEPILNGSYLIEQMFDLWIMPHITAKQLDIDRDRVVQALVVLTPNQPPEVLLNENARLLATVKVRDAVASGEPVTADNVKHIGGIVPADIDPAAGWMAFACLPGGGAIVGFDFRYNKDQASALLAQAADFLATARDALAAERFGPVIENALAAAELAVTALTSLQNSPLQKRSSHHARTHWLNNYTRYGSAPQTYHQAVKRLLELRPAARYGEGRALPGSTELAGILDQVEALVTHAADYTRENATAS